MFAALRRARHGATTSSIPTEDGLSTAWAAAPIEKHDWTVSSGRSLRDTIPREPFPPAAGCDPLSEEAAGSAGDPDLSQHLRGGITWLTRPAGRSLDCRSLDAPSRAAGQERLHAMPIAVGGRIAELSQCSTAGSHSPIGRPGNRTCISLPDRDNLGRRLVRAGSLARSSIRCRRKRSSAPQTLTNTHRAAAAARL